MKNNNAFTLIEVMVCIVLTCIVVFFVYTMMLASHRTYAKLFSISKQRNDIRYFETLIKNSITNAEYIEVSGTSSEYKITFSYHVTDTRINDGVECRRFDEYKFTNPNVVLKNATESERFISESNLQNYINNSSNIIYRVYCKDYNSNNNVNNLNFTALRERTLLGETLIISGINRFAWNVVDYDSPFTDTDGKEYNHHAYFTFSLIFSRTLSDGEVNTEAQLYRISMRNLRCMDKHAQVDGLTYGTF